MSQTTLTLTHQGVTARYSPGSAALVRALVRAPIAAADDGGTIQARDAARLLPHERPEWHGCQSLATALGRVGAALDEEHGG